jgi:nickel/cobalt exporter
MPDFVHALQSGSTSLWLFIPSAILLGVLHGLEPGHSKTMMAAFIIAIRGTVGQAVLLGLSAAISHSLLIWLLAASALHYGNKWNAETIEPYLQIGSAVAIYALALWMFVRTRRTLHEAHAHHHHHHHDHGHEHGPAGHHHHDHGGHEHGPGESFILETGNGAMELRIFEEGVPPVFQVRVPSGARLPQASSVSIETVRPDGDRRTYQFVMKEGFLESSEAIPEPHEFDALLTVEHAGHRHTCRAEFREGTHLHETYEGPGSPEYQDAHEREHAEQLMRRFEGRAVSTPQIMLFGITGGLMPCPAAFSILLVCLQLKRVALGFVMVGAFSFGLALTMVATGTLAALSVHHAEKHFRGFGEFARRAPYISCVLLVVIASYMAWNGWNYLHS